MLRLWLLALFLAIANASFVGRRETGFPDSNEGPKPENGVAASLAATCYLPFDEYSGPVGPCQIARVIGDQCIFGFGFYEKLPNDSRSMADFAATAEYPVKEQSPEFQRDCFCKSQFLDQTIGCLACIKRHGGSERDIALNSGLLPSVMKAYCNLSVTPTANFSENMKPAMVTKDFASLPPTALLDPLSSSTAVSLYYTQSESGIEAWYTNLSTIGGWALEPTVTGASTLDSANVTFTTTSAKLTTSSHGDSTDITSSSAATKSNTTTTSEDASGTTASATASSDAGAVQSGIPSGVGAIAGVLGLAGMLAAL